MLLYVIKKEKGNPIKIYKIIKAKHKIRKFRLFDKKYYLKKYPNVKSIINPLDHYIYHGYKEYKNPSELFDNNYYLNKYSDVKKSRHNPLIHYVLYGKKEGRFPNKKSENNSIESLYSRLEKQKKKIKKLEEKIKKQSKIYKIKSINKEKVSWQIEKFGDLGIIKKKRNPKLIVSLTSYPDRIYDIHYCLYSLLNQSLKPDEVILWLSREEFRNLEEDIPKKTLQLRKNGLKIKWCDNLKSYKKLIFALKEYPNDIIVTADDDVYYPKNWLEKIYNEYDEKTIVCHRAHFVNFDDSKFKKYEDWDRNIENKNASFLNFATGVGGVLYPPKSLHPDVLNEDLFIKLAPNADDIWFWVMGVLNGIKTKVVPDGYRILNYINPKRELNVENEETLYSKNKNGGNDSQMENIVNYYPQIKNILKNEYSPKVSIIIPVHNTSKYLKKCMDSVINQKLKDIEIICINDESTDNSLEILEDYAIKDKRIKIINQVNQGVSIARNTGLKIAKGEYVGFVDSDDWIDLNFFYELYNKAKSQGADLARTFYKYEYPYKTDEEKLNKIIKKRNKEREQLNVNDHSVVIWNAIYKRKYIEKNKIYFDDINGANDVPFTAKATYFSKKSIPVIGTYYHYRKEVKNRLTTMNYKRVNYVIKSNKITLKFINSVQYDDLDDYLIAFKRCMWRYDDTFGKSLKLKEFKKNNQEKFFNDFVDEFHKCKYIGKLKEDYYEPYFEYLDKNKYEEYVDYKKNIKKNFK